MLPGTRDCAPAIPELKLLERISKPHSESSLRIDGPIIEKVIGRPPHRPVGFKPGAVPIVGPTLGYQIYLRRGRPPLTRGCIQGCETKLLGCLGVQPQNRRIQSASL